MMDYLVSTLRMPALVTIVVTVPHHWISKISIWLGREMPVTNPVSCPALVFGY